MVTSSTTSLSTEALERSLARSSQRVGVLDHMVDVLFLAPVLRLRRKLLWHSHVPLPAVGSALPAVVALSARADTLHVSPSSGLVDPVHWLAHSYP